MPASWPGKDHTKVARNRRSWDIIPGDLLLEAFYVEGHRFPGEEPLMAATALGLAGWAPFRDAIDSATGWADEEDRLGHLALGLPIRLCSEPSSECALRLFIDNYIAAAWSKS